MAYLCLKIDISHAQALTGPKIAFVFRSLADKIEGVGGWEASVASRQTVEAAIGPKLIVVRDKNGDPTGEMWVDSSDEAVFWGEGSFEVKREE